MNRRTAIIIGSVVAGLFLLSCCGVSGGVAVWLVQKQGSQKQVAKNSPLPNGPNHRLWREAMAAFTIEAESATAMIERNPKTDPTEIQTKINLGIKAIDGIKGNRDLDEDQSATAAKIALVNDAKETYLVLFEASELLRTNPKAGVEDKIRLARQLLQKLKTDPLITQK